jgi:DNA-directed RNA polymerase subunit RPC12/RpoP
VDELLDVVQVAAIVVPLAFVLLLGAVFVFSAHYREPPLVFRCARCGHEFTRRAWKRFPTRCTACGAREWNA